MKIKLYCKDDEKDKYLQELKLGNIEESEDPEFFIIHRNLIIDSLLGKNGKAYTILKPEDILYIESYENDIICTTMNQKYHIREKLFEVEYMLSRKGFLRISKSYVVNFHYIENIYPTINMKYKLKMKNNDVIYVTRSYYYKFKDYVGL